MRKVKTETEVVTEVTADDGGVTEITEIISKKQTLNRVGWYLYGELQPFRFGWLSGLSAGFRYDWTEYPINTGHQWAVGPYLTYKPSEFLRFRVGYKHTEGNTPGCCTNTGSAARGSRTSSSSSRASSWARTPPIRSRRGRSHMRTFIRTFIACVIALGVLAGGADAADKVRVVTTTTDLKSLTEAVGGDLVEVDALARGTQNPHDLEVRPSLMVKVRRADILVVNGLDLDNWVDVVVQGANNARVIPGAPGLGRCVARHPGAGGAHDPRRPLHGRRASRSAIRTTPWTRAWPRSSPRISSRGWRARPRSTARPSRRTARTSWLVSSRPWRNGRRPWSRSEARRP